MFLLAQEGDDSVDWKDFRSWESRPLTGPGPMGVVVDGP